MLLVAILGGLLGSLFNYANAAVSEWRRRNLRAGCRRSMLTHALCIAAVTSTVTFVLPLFVACKARISPPPAASPLLARTCARTHPRSFHCTRHASTLP